MTIESPGGDTHESVRLHRPTIHGKQVAFIANGGLWLGDCNTEQTTHIPVALGEIQNVFFSPDGKDLAFTFIQGESAEVGWLSLERREPHQVTFGLRGSECLGWCPVSDRILFRSARSNPTNRNRIYRVDRQGRPPEPVEIPDAELAAINPQGDIVFVPYSVEQRTRKRYHGGRADTLWLLAGGQFVPLTNGAQVDTMPVWAGSHLCFVSHPRGEREPALWILNPSKPNGSARPLAGPSPVAYPQFHEGTLVFEWEDRIGIMDVQSGAFRALAFRVPPTAESRAIRKQPVTELFAQSPHVWPIAERHALSSSGDRLHLEVRGQILEVDRATGKPLACLAIRGARCTFPTPSPDDSELAFICDAPVGDSPPEDRLWIRNAEGVVHRLTDELPHRPDRPVWSSDGKFLVLADHAGQLLLVNRHTGKHQVIDTAPVSATLDDATARYGFSPDGKWVAYAQRAENWRLNVKLYHVETGARFRVTTSDLNCGAPTFSPDGRRLYFLVDRTFERRFSRINYLDHVRVVSSVAFVPIPDDLEKQLPEALPGDPDPLLPLLDQLEILKIGAGRPTDLQMTPKHLLVAIEGEPFDLIGFDAQSLTPGVNPARSLLVRELFGFVVARSGSTLLLQQGSVLTSLDTKMPIVDGVPQVERSPEPIPLDQLEVEVHPFLEWQQIQDEVWRWARDFSWNPKRAGSQAWAQARGHYRARLLAVTDRRELNILLREMLAELEMSHIAVTGGDVPLGSGSQNIGYLGADLRPHPDAGAWEITRILKADPYQPEQRSPLARFAPALAQGKRLFLTAINGERVRTDRSLESQLRIPANDQPALLTLVADPADSQTQLTPIRLLRDETTLRIEDLERRASARVEQALSGSAGYIRLTDMSTKGLARFMSRYHVLLDRAALILDLRGNQGGFISNTLLLYLEAKSDSYLRPRSGASFPRANYAFGREVVVLCDETTISNGEEFCCGIQELRLGTVIGRRTEGSGVGAVTIPVLDGGSARIPNFGLWSPGTRNWIIENQGCQPKPEIAYDPHEELAGDAILEAAIKFLQKKCLSGDPLKGFTPQYPP